jgi:hypothetical protein
VICQSVKQGYAQSSPKAAPVAEQPTSSSIRHRLIARNWRKMARNSRKQACRLPVLGRPAFSGRVPHAAASYRGLSAQQHITGAWFLARGGARGRLFMRNPQQILRNLRNASQKIKGPHRSTGDGENGSREKASVS